MGSPGGKDVAGVCGVDRADDRELPPREDRLDEEEDGIAVDSQADKVVAQEKMVVELIGAVEGNSVEE